MNELLLSLHMQLSVIILNYNVKHFLEVCIKSVQKAIATLDAEIIVVDNGSTDGSKDMIRDVFPDVTYLYQNTNAGFPKGNNIGVSVAKGTFICILNPDTIVSENTFTTLLNTHESLINPGILGCLLIDGSGVFLHESKRSVPTPWVAFTKVFSLYKFFPNNKSFNKYYAQNVEQYNTGAVDILVGAFMFLKRDVYLKVGGFDEGCFMYSDDIDLSYCVLKEGYQNYYVGETSVIHFKGESTIKDGTYMKRFKEAMQFFYQKHFKKSVWFDGLMNVGIFFFALKKQSEKVEVKHLIDTYFIISKNIFVIDRIKKMGISVEVFNSVNEVPKKKLTKHVEVLVDSDFCTYLDYINFIKHHAKTNKTFKIRPENSNYFLGSNDKNDKGEILQF